MTTESAAPKTHIEKFQHLLRELFQFDSADLDFGIYRIMNYKRDAVEKFIAEDLPKVISDDLEQGVLAEQDRADAELEETRQQVEENFGKDALGDNGELQPVYGNTPLGKEYLKARARAAGARSREAIEIDIFNHLYAFFSAYYEDGDFIAKRRYAKRQQYAIPYNGEEVHLHWANRDQYYVKTGEHFRDYDWKAPNGIAVHFRIEAADVEQNNVKGAKRFFLPIVEGTNYDADNRAIAIPFEYRPLTETETETYGKQKQQDTIIAAAVAAIKQLGTATDELSSLTGERYRNAKGDAVSHLEHHLRQYTRRNTSDFFIHKDLKGFLARELDFYLKNEVLKLDEMTAIGENIAGGWFQILRVIKAVGGQIIDFLDQIECFQKMLWEKRKFITETQYCIALGAIDDTFHPAIAACDPQWAEWKALFHIDEDAINLFNSGKDTQGKRVAFLQAHPTLVLDTRHFDADFTDRLLASFDDLDSMTDGLLIHSENYQALNLLREKYAEQVKCIYIDPPYNTGQDNDFLYKDNYQHSSWMAMMRGCLSMSRALAAPSSGIFVSTDDGEYANLKFVLDQAWGVDNFVADVIWNSRKSVSSDTLISIATNHTTFFAADKKALDSQKGKFRLRQSGEKFSNPDNDPLGPWVLDPMDAPNVRENLTYVIVNPSTGKDFLPPSGRCWRFEQWKTEELLSEGRIVFGYNGDSRPMYKRYLSEALVKGKAPTTLWDDVKTTTDATRLLLSLFGETLPRKLIDKVKPKPKELIERCVTLLTDWKGVVLDYFAGSGTTGHAVINLNREDGGRRKFILVEMGEYFDTVLLPRIKKVSFTAEWKDGKPKRDATPEEAERSPRIVKYMRVESYEDALNNIAFDDAAVQLKLEERFDDYLIKYMLQWETKDSATLLNTPKLTRPFTYRLRTHANGETQDRMVDISETFNYLLGLNVQTRRVYEDEGRRYVVYRGETRDAPGRDVAVIYREIEGWERADFDRDRRFVIDQGLADGAEVVYVNGDSCILGAAALDPMFKARMFAEVAR